MSLPDHVIEAARLAYQEGKISEDRLDSIACHRRLKRFVRFQQSKFKKLSDDDKFAIAEHAAFFSLRPIDPELLALAQGTIKTWNCDSAYQGSFGFAGEPVGTDGILRHYLCTISAEIGPRQRTRHLRLSTAGLNQAARILMPYLPKGMAWTVTGGAYVSEQDRTSQRTPSMAESWLLKQLCLIETRLLCNQSAARGIVREVINRTKIGREDKLAPD